jgi:ABC-2 type transport system ATP-binding protein
VIEVAPNAVLRADDDHAHLGRDIQRKTAVEARRMSAAPVIMVERLSKHYGLRAAVTELTFQIMSREVVGFLGPNGAGKTTTLRMIAGFLGPSAGYVRVGGLDVLEEPLAARRKLGYMPEHCPLYPEMRVSEYLRFRAALKGVERNKRGSYVGRALALAQLDSRAESIIGHLSKGYRQRVGLADALVAQPEVLILDEPTSGLDPNQIRDVRQVIATLKQEHTVLLSTHILREVEASCDRVLVIHHGKLVADSTIAELALRRQTQRFELLLMCSGSAVPETMSRAVSTREELAGERERWIVEPSSEPARKAGLASIDQWVEALVTNGVRVLGVSAVGSSLEEAFEALTRDAEPRGAEPRDVEGAA